MTKLILTIAAAIFRSIEFPAKAGIRVHSETDGPRGRCHGDSVGTTAVKAKKLILSYVALLSVFFMSSAHTAICPDPNNSSLAWGVVPPPWEINPFSDNRPQGEKNTRFIRANILVAGFGRGVVCNYLNSQGYYSIWWPVSVKIPARTENDWRDSLAGFECTSSLEQCVFYPGSCAQLLH